MKQHQRVSRVIRRLPIVKTQLPCCALCFLSSTDNRTTKEELQEFIAKLEKEAFSQDWTNPASRASGERSIITITTPMEIKLSETLQEVGFSKLDDSLKRRIGYPDGDLTLWIYKF